MFCVNFIAEIQTLFIEKTITNKILKHMKKTLQCYVKGDKIHNENIHVQIWKSV